MSKTLHLKGSGKLLLNMNDTQFNDLVRLLQEESTTDRDYYVDETVVGFLEEKGADAHLVRVLRQALESKRSAYRDPATPEPTKSEDEDEGDGIDIVWRDLGEDA